MVAMTIKKRQVLDKLLCPKMDIKIFFLIRQQEDRTKKRNDKSLIINTFKNFLFCDSVAIRTQDPRLRRALLYPAELRNQP